MKKARQSRDRRRQNVNRVLEANVQRQQSNRFVLIYSTVIPLISRKSRILANNSKFPYYSYRVQENGEPLLNNDQRPNQNPSPHDAQEYDPVKEMIEQSWAEQQRQQHQHQHQRAPFQQQQSRQSQQNNQDSLSETNLAIALIAICVLHLVCQILRVFLAGLAVYLVFDTVYCMEVEQRFIPPLWTMCAESVSSILIMINASGKYTVWECKKFPTTQILREINFQFR